MNPALFPDQKGTEITLEKETKMRQLNNDEREQLEALGDLSACGSGKNRYWLTVRWTDRDDETADTEDDSIPAKVENILPDALCEHADSYENGEHEFEISFPDMTFFVCGNGGADDEVIDSFDDLLQARTRADEEEQENRIFDSGKGFGESGFDAFIVRAVNSDHAIARAARGPYEARS